jgi:small-conductance mechanosensitive channel/CRP-like cAMP-binding protein
MLERYLQSGAAVLLYPVVGWMCTLALARWTNIPRIALRRVVLCFAIFAVLWMVALAIPFEPTNERLLRLTAWCVFLIALARLGLLASLYAAGKAFGWQGQKIYADISTFVACALIVTIGLKKAGVESTELFTGSAIVTALLALSLKETAGNMLAGVAIHIQQPFVLGDWIQFDEKKEHIGQVQESNWRATTIRTLDGTHIIIPNSRLAESPISNFSNPMPKSRRSVFFSCPHNVSPLIVHDTVKQAVLGVDGVCSEPAPSMVTNAFTERGVEYWLRYFIEAFDSRDKIDGAVRDRVWFSLTREGIALSTTSAEIYVTKVRRGAFDIDPASMTSALSKLPLFEKIPADVMAGLVAGVESRVFLEGETIVTEGDHSTELFVLMKGDAIVYKNRNSQNVELARLNKGDFFGERSLLLGEPRSASVVAAVSCELVVLTKNHVQRIICEHPSVAELLAQALATRHRETQSHLNKVNSSPEPASETSVLAGIQRFFSME